MPTNYAPQPRAHASVRLPSDGDNFNAASLNAPLTRVADMARYAFGVYAKNLRPVSLPAQLTNVRPTQVYGVGLGERGNGLRMLAAVGQNNAAQPTIHLSIGGEHWSEVARPAGVGVLRAVAFSKPLQRWVAVGESFGGRASMATSVDGLGLVWTAVTTPADGTLYSVAVSDAGTFVAVGKLAAGGPYLLRSVDGVTWSQVVPPIGLPELRQVVFANGAFVAVGGDPGGMPARVLRSETGEAWLEQSAPTPYTLESVCWNGRAFFAFGIGGHIVSSPDGFGWTAVNTIANEFQSAKVCAADPLTGVLLFSGDYKRGIIASYDDAATLESGYLMASSDQLHLALDVHALAFLDGRFVAACSDGHVAIGPRR